MRESGYFPQGAEFDPSAPYNEVPTPKRDFDVKATITMSKVVTVKADANTSDTDWKQVCDENGHYTIPELLAELETYIEQDLERYKGFERKELFLRRLLEECINWEVVEEFYEEQ